MANPAADEPTASTIAVGCVVVVVICAGGEIGLGNSTCSACTLTRLRGASGLKIGKKNKFLSHVFVFKLNFIFLQVLN